MGVAVSMLPTKLISIPTFSRYLYVRISHPSVSLYLMSMSPIGSWWKWFAVCSGFYLMKFGDFTRTGRRSFADGDRGLLSPSSRWGQSDRFPSLPVPSYSAASVTKITVRWDSVVPLTFTVKSPALGISVTEGACGVTGTCSDRLCAWLSNSIGDELQIADTCRQIRKFPWSDRVLSGPSPLIKVTAIDFLPTADIVVFESTASFCFIFRRGCCRHRCEERSRLREIDYKQFAVGVQLVGSVSLYIIPSCRMLISSFTGGQAFLAVMRLLRWSLGILKKMSLAAHFFPWLYPAYE